MDFEAMAQAISEIHRRTRTGALRAVNVALTCRNWLIGAYIHEYELRGQDRAEYGERLFDRLAQRLAALSVPNCNRSRLYRYRDLYRLYPQIGEALPGAYDTLRPPALASAPNSVATPLPQSPAGKVATLSPLSGQFVLERLSYSHLELLIEIDAPLKRAFYEIECLHGNWSVRELKRQKDKCKTNPTEEPRNFVAEDATRQPKQVRVFRDRIVKRQMNRQKLRPNTAAIAPEIARVNGTSPNDRPLDARVNGPRCSLSQPGPGFRLPGRGQAHPA